MSNLHTAIAFFFLIQVAANNITENKPAVQKLREHLLEFYNPAIRPVYNVTDTSIVIADMAVNQIIDVDEKRQLLKAAFWMRLYWKDEFLNWIPEEWNDVKSIYFKPNRIWVPDACIFNALEPAVYTNDMEGFVVSVDHTGNATWLSPLIVETFCQFNVKYFPYDTQFCTLIMGSWVYSAQEVDIQIVSSQGDTVALNNNVEWDVTNYTIEKTVQQYYSDPYVEIHMNLTLRRKPGFYVTYLYIPPVVIIFSALFAFCLPPGSDTKIDLAVIGLLSQTVFLLIISDLMPPDAQNPPVLGECLTALLIVQAAAIMAVVVVKRIHDDSNHKRHPPGRRLLRVLNILKYPFFLWHINYQSFLDEFEADSLSSNKYAERSTDGLFFVDDEKDGYQSSEANTKDDKTQQNSLQNLLKESKEKRLKVQRQKSIDKQWKYVAAMYDRVLFLVFVVIIGSITIWFLTLQPTEESQKFKANKV